MYVGDVRLRGLDRDAWHSWPKHPAGWLALCPLPSTDTYQFQAQIPPDEEQEPSLRIFQRIVRERTQRDDIELTEAPWTSLYRVNIRMVSRYRIGRVFLAETLRTSIPGWRAGNEHRHSGFVQPPVETRSFLKGAPGSLLDTYEEERLPVAANVLGLSTKLHKAIAVGKEEGMRRDAIALQLGITYKEMSLNTHSGGTQSNSPPAIAPPTLQAKAPVANPFVYSTTSVALTSPSCAFILRTTEPQRSNPVT